MQVTLNKSEKIIYDILINDIDVVDALNIITQYAKLTNIKVNGERHARDGIESMMQQKRRKSRKTKSKDYPDEDEYSLTADEALLLAARHVSETLGEDPIEKNYKGSPITKEEFLEAFDQRLEDMRAE
jgi:hypothetical protein